jgi:hypothetical protein
MTSPYLGLVKTGVSALTRLSKGGAEEVNAISASSRQRKAETVVRVAGRRSPGGLLYGDAIGADRLIVANRIHLCQQRRYQTLERRACIEQARPRILRRLARRLASNRPNEYQERL